MRLLDGLARASHEPVLPFPRSEYDQRLETLRVRMQGEGVDLLLVSDAANIAYLTGYDTTMPSGYAVLLVPYDGNLTLHCSELEAPCMDYNGIVEDLQVFYWFEAADTATHLAQVLAAGGYVGRTIGVEMGNAETFASGAMDAKSFVTLQRALAPSEIVDATAYVLDQRLIKSERELEYMRQAGTYTWAGLRAGLAAIAEGVTDNEVIAAVYHGLMSAGSENPSIDPMIMAGERCGWMPHQPFRRYTIAQGDSVYFEISGVHNRYNAPSMRSATVGEPSYDVQRLAEASIEAVRCLLENIKPGRTGHEIAMIAEETKKSIPDACSGGAFGYSIGLGMKPTWTEAPMYIAAGVDRPLEVGMTFHLPNGRWIPERRCGAGFSESVVVTERGCECLTPNVDMFLTAV